MVLSHKILHVHELEKTMHVIFFHSYKYVHFIYISFNGTFINKDYMAFNYSMASE
jgi:hypothetical protein